MSVNKGLNRRTNFLEKVKYCTCTSALCNWCQACCQRRAVQEHLFGVVSLVQAIEQNALVQKPRISRGLAASPEQEAASAQAMV